MYFPWRGTGLESSPAIAFSWMRGHTWDSTTCPWAWSSGPCTRSGTTRWGSPGCHSRSSRRSWPGGRGSRRARWGRPACRGPPGGLGGWGRGGSGWWQAPSSASSSSSLPPSDPSSCPWSSSWLRGPPPPPPSQTEIAFPSPEREIFWVLSFSINLLKLWEVWLT